MICRTTLFIVVPVNSSNFHFGYHFEARFPKKNIPSIRDYEFTPAELVNMYLYSNKKESEFIERVTNNIEI